MESNRHDGAEREPGRDRSDDDWSHIDGDDVTIEHPNREKAQSKTTRLVVLLLMLASAVLIGFLTIAGWDVVSSMAGLSILYIALYIVLAWFVIRWHSGMLPVIAGLATVVGINALVATPAWFDRHAEGYTLDTLDPVVGGTVSAILIPLQILLIIFAMIGFRQGWNVEVERDADGSTHMAPAH